MNKKPLILIAWGPCLDEQFSAPGMMLAKAYVWAVSANGGLPLVPLDHKCIPDYVRIADGLILPGAMGYTPLEGWDAYGDAQGHARKEAFESDLYQAFKAAGKPILGICDGHQKINCEEGGTLTLAVMAEYGSVHFLSAHPIENEKDSFIGQAWGERAVVNSYHGWCTDRLGEDLVITARAADGVPEALEHKTLPIYGVQFHPERMRGDNIFPTEGSDGDRLIGRFIEICREKRGQEGNT